MGIEVRNNADGSVTVSCGDESVTIKGPPAATEPTGRGTGNYVVTKNSGAISCQVVGRHGQFDLDVLKLLKEGYIISGTPKPKGNLLVDHCSLGLPATKTLPISTIYSSIRAKPETIDLEIHLPPFGGTKLGE